MNFSIFVALLSEMKSLFSPRNILILVLVLFNAGCDQVSKVIVRERIEYNEHIEVVSDYFTLTKIENTGAFLSLGHSLPNWLRIILLLSLPMIVIAAALYYILTRKELSMFLVTGICFALGGGIGNIYDRIVYGSVTDFMHMDFGLFRTGIFNFGDVSITIGIIMILLHSIFAKKTPESPESNPENSNASTPQ